MLSPSAEWMLMLVALLMLVAQLGIVVVHTIYVRRVHREELSLLRSMSVLTHNMSEAITWLVNDARRDIKAETAHTRQTVQDAADEIKQEIHSAKNGGRP